MAATRVDGTGSSKRLPYLLYEVITNNATTYTLRLSLGVNNKNSTDYYATTESYISKKIGSGAASFVYASSSVRVRSGDTIIISNTTWTITKTHASQSISVGGVPYLDHAPVGSVVKALTVPARTSYAVTFNANSGSGAPAQQTKWYGEALPLSSAKPTKDGYTFKGWATSEANAKSGTVDYASGATVAANTNSALNLWAVWELTYSKPTITNLHIERCDASGTADDEGTLALVSFDWSVFRSSATRYYNGSTTPYTSTTVQSCSVTVGTVTATPTLTGASGSASVVVGSAGSFLTDTQYNASVTITDTVDSAIQPSHSSTVTGTLSTTFFPMDFNQDASALGFFRPAPDNGDGVYFGKSIYVDGDATIGGMPIKPQKITLTPVSPFALYGETPIIAVKMGNVVMVNGVVKVTANTALNQTQITICTLPEGWKPDYTVYAVTQGSGTAIALLDVTASGEIKLSRLRDMASANGAYTTATSSMWFPFTITFVIA